MREAEGAVERGRCLLERFTSGDFPFQMSLLIVKILQLEMQPVNLLSRLRCLTFRVPSAELCRSVEAT